jgi:succinylarginine dihydrolase
VLTAQQAAAMHQGVIFTEALHAQLVTWVERHYRDRLSPADLADPALAGEIDAALTALTGILGMPTLYDLPGASPL